MFPYKSKPSNYSGAIHKLCYAKIGNFDPPLPHVTLSVEILIDLNKRKIQQ